VLPAAAILPEPAVNDPPVGKEDAAWRTGCRAVRARMTPVRNRRGLGEGLFGMRCGLYK
jgi:hypothetical protein